MTKERLDRLLVDRGLVAGRNQAYTAIIAGEVKVDGRTCRKPDLKVEDTADILYRPTGEDYVSRGGLKLEKALDSFGVDVTGLTAIDAGAATGGFTDCLLRRGAAKVIAIDVGYGQLAWGLRNDPRVDVRERVNIRYMKLDDIGAPADVAALDLSFISLVKVIPAVAGLLEPEGFIIALVKPQFEAGKGRVGKGGVVRDPALHSEVLAAVTGELLGAGLSLLGMTHSPIRGPKGNIEFWLYLSKKASVGYPIKDMQALADSTVLKAHKEL